MKVLLPFLCVLVAAVPLRGAAPDFNRDIRPILARHCLGCHGPEKQESGLRVDRRQSLLVGGDSGDPAVRPGKPASGELVRRITSRDPEMMMPPKGARLDAAAVRTISEWIQRGAVMPDDADPRETHWSFRPLKPVPLPTVPASASNRIRSPIDTFVIARLHANRLQLSGPATRRRLLLSLIHI